MDTMESLWQSFGHTLDAILPKSPFTSVIEKIENLPYLSYVNWFVPVKDMIKIMSVWVAAIAIYYLAMVVLRWIKVIQG